FVGFENIEKALVRPNLELLTRLLVDEGTPENRVLVDLRRQRDRPGHACTSATSRVGDLARGLVEQLVVVGLQPDADFEVFHGDVPLGKCGSVASKLSDDAGLQVP